MTTICRWLVWRTPWYEASNPSSCPGNGNFCISNVVLRSNTVGSISESYLIVGPSIIALGSGKRFSVENNWTTRIASLSELVHFVPSDQAVRLFWSAELFKLLSLHRSTEKFRPTKFWRLGELSQTYHYTRFVCIFCTPPINLLFPNWCVPND